MEATLLPWRAVEGTDGLPSNGPSCHHIIGPQGHLIAHLPYDRFGKADADFIVKAANAHDRLIEALEALVGEIENSDTEWGISSSLLVGAYLTRDQLAEARTALALARGEVVA